MSTEKLPEGKLDAVNPHRRHDDRTDALATISSCESSSGSTMTKEELERELSRLRQQVEDEKLKIESGKRKAEFEQCEKELKKDAGALDAGISELGPLFLFAIPFLIAASRYRHKALEAKDTNNLEAMRSYLAKAKNATQCGKIFAALVTAGLLVLLVVGVWQLFIHLFGNF